VPVSRKRKKKSGKAGRSRGSAAVDQRGFGADLTRRDSHELADAFQGLVAYRDHVDAQRASLAAVAATDLVAGLVAAVADEPDVIVEDVLCLRLGALLGEQEQVPVDTQLRPRDMPGPLVDAAVATVRASKGQTDAWRAPWQVLTAVAGVLPYSDSEAVAGAIAQLRNTMGSVLPAKLSGPDVSGPVLWARDRYGSRFAVAAPIVVADQPVRWYLWDIDACGHEAFTVHSGFYPTSEAALAAWQTEVGGIAAAGAELTPVDDPWLLAELLPAAEGIFGTGGESVAQFAEYHRSRRLAEAVKQVTRVREPRPDGGGLDAAAAAVEFTLWLRSVGGGRRDVPADLDELARELADSWCLNDIAAVYATCSPHRVALCVPHVRNYYLDDFAERLVALLPEWIRWLGERNAIPRELTDRCLPYLEGQSHSELGMDDVRPDYLARVAE
jgi:hypothetical protein